MYTIEQDGFLHVKITNPDGVTVRIQVDPKDPAQAAMLERLVDTANEQYVSEWKENDDE